MCSPLFVRSLTHTKMKLEPRWKVNRIELVNTIVRDIRGINHNTHYHLVVPRPLLPITLESAPSPPNNSNGGPGVAMMLSKAIIAHVFRRVQPPSAPGAGPCVHSRSCHCNESYISAPFLRFPIGCIAVNKSAPCHKKKWACCSCSLPLSSSFSCP